MDADLCRECDLCVGVCPVGAIASASQPLPAEGRPAQVPVPRPEAEVIRIQTEPRPLSLKSRVLPAVGAALVWAGREIVPYLAEHLLDSLDRRSGEGQLSSRDRGERSPASRSGGGRRRRRRRRGE